MGFFSPGIGKKSLLLLSHHTAIEALDVRRASASMMGQSAYGVCVRRRVFSLLVLVCLLCLLMFFFSSCRPSPSLFFNSIHVNFTNI